MNLVICEKPSVAMSIAKVIGATGRQDGYYEGGGYIVSWCVGHLIQMASPSAYDEKYGKWRLEDLPIIPDKYKYEVVKTTRGQFNTLKKLMNSKEVEKVINACDAGREGELIFRLVYEQSGCKKNIKRLWISSMEDMAIKEGFKQLKDGKEYEALYQSALARSKADWLVGMNMSRLYSLIYYQNYSVGRVQTPTLAMIVKRDDEITAFKKEKYYIGELYFTDFTLSTDRIDSIEIVEDLVNLVGNKIVVRNVEKKERFTKPDLPFDLTTLQRECNKYFGYSAKQTLDYAQSLYEKKMITYPRTDSRYLSEDMIINTVNSILCKNDFYTKKIKVIFNSTKITDHHAIIPTVSSLEEDMSTIPESERKIYKLILNKLHESAGYPLIENITKIVAVYESQGDVFEFKASGKVITDEGFTKYLKQYGSKKNEDIVLPDVNVGDLLEIKDKEIKENIRHHTSILQRLYSMKCRLEK